MIQSDFLNYCDSMKELQNCHLLRLQKITTFIWYPTIVTKNRVFNKWRRFDAPLFDCYPQTPGLYPPLHHDI